MAENPTYEPSGGEGALSTTEGVDKDQLVTTLQGYLNEAKEARRSGENPRDDKWTQNLNLYWNRYDFSKKAGWQAKEVMPEVPVFVDRFAAALKEALVATPQGFYTVTDPSDKENDLAQSVKRMTDGWLSTAGRNQVGQLIGFPAVFEEQMKLGALTVCASVVTWKGDVPPGRVAVESIDPRLIWLDHTGRNLYRIRRTELDRHELPELVSAKDAKGNSIFDAEGLNALISGLSVEDERWRQEMTGAGTNVSSSRKPVTLDEYIATVLDNHGEVIAERALIVLANEKYLVRGPEKNPFMHGKDWITYAPLVTAPLSVYGRSYMEDFGSLANTFTELTNMILDAVHTSSLKAYAMVPGMLLNPEQAATGLAPNKLFLLEDGSSMRDFAAALDFGSLSADSFRMWQAMKTELREAASVNEIGIGQFAPNARTSATEINETQQSSSALIRSVAQTVETRWLDPTLDLVWKTGVQHVSDKDKAMMEAAGEEMFRALVARKKELIARPITFQARGISSLIARSQMLRSMMQLLSVVSQNDLLLQEFLKEIDLNKFVKKLFELSNVDLSTIQLSEREKLIRAATQPMQEAQAAAQGAPGGGGPAAAQAQDITRTMGIGR